MGKELEMTGARTLQSVVLVLSTVGWETPAVLFLLREQEGAGALARNDEYRQHPGHCRILLSRAPARLSTARSPLHSCPWWFWKQVLKVKVGDRCLNSLSGLVTSSSCISPFTSKTGVI